VLYQTAIKDNFTGVLPAIGNNIWGHGKVNAYASLKTMTDLLGVVLVQKGTLSVKVYPNPNHGGFYIDCTNDRTEMATVEVLNILGKVLVREELRLSAGNNIHPVDARYLSNGVYFLRITTASKGQQTRKVVID